VIEGVKATCTDDDFQATLGTLLETSKQTSVVFEYCQEQLGLEKSLEILASRWEAEKEPEVLITLCQYTPEDRGDDLKGRLAAGFDGIDISSSDATAVGHQLQFVGFMKKFGFRELAKKSAEQISVADGYWTSISPEAEEFVDWFREHFHLPLQLSISDVIEAESKLFFQFDKKEGGQFTPYRIQLATINAAGIGAVIDPGLYSLDTSFYERIAKFGGDKFLIQAHHTDEKKRARLLINDKLYEFTIPNMGSAAHYSTEPTCNVLNTILKRQKYEERFFLLNFDRGNSYVHLVMFAKPSKMRQFLDMYPDDFSDLKGCHKFFGSIKKARRKVR